VTSDLQETLSGFEDSLFGFLSDTDTDALNLMQRRVYMTKVGGSQNRIIGGNVSGSLAEIVGQKTARGLRRTA